MDLDKLQERIKNATEKVNKIQSTLNKHRELASKKREELKNKYGISDPDNVNSRDYTNNNDIWELIYSYSSRLDSIKDNEKKLAEAERKLQELKDKYSAQSSAEKKILDSVPKVIMDFMDGWEIRAREYYMSTCKEYLERRKKLWAEQRIARIHCLRETPEYARFLDPLGNPIDEYVLNPYPRVHMKNYLSEHKISESDINEKLKKYGSAVRWMSDEYWIKFKHQGFTSDIEDMLIDKVCNFVAREKQDMLLNLVAQVMDRVGDITDASQLHIGYTGGIEGIICGTKGKVRIQTIDAGGYNIQCYHFRTLIHDLKD